MKNGPSTGRNGKMTATAHAYDPEKFFFAQNVEKSMDFQVCVTFVSRNTRETSVATWKSLVVTFGKKAMVTNAKSMHTAPKIYAF